MAPPPQLTPKHYKKHPSTLVKTPPPQLTSAIGGVLDSVPWPLLGGDGGGYKSVTRVTRAGLADVWLLRRTIQAALRYHFRFTVHVTESKYDECYYVLHDSGDSTSA